MFVVFCQAPIPIEPAEGSFDDPAFGQDLESVKLGAFDDLEQVTKHGLAPIDDALFIAAIDRILSRDGRIRNKWIRTR